MFLERRLANPKWAHSYTGMFWSSMVFYGGTPSPPPAPDYAASNRAGVIADAQTLASRRAIDNAAKTGGTAMQFGAEERTRPLLADGVTTKGGKYYLNGAEIPATQAETGTEKYYVQLFNDKGTRYKTPLEISETEAVVNFEGLSDLDVSKKMADFQRAEGRSTAQYLLDLQTDYGSKFAQQAREQLRAVDPTGFDLRENLAKESLGTEFKKIDDLPEFRQYISAPQLELAEDGPTLTRTSTGPQFGNLNSGSTLERIGSGPQFGLQNYGPQFAAGTEVEGGGAVAIGRSEVERQLGEALFSNGQLTPAEERRLNNSVRGAQTSRGNVYGNAPIAQEILARYGAENEKSRMARTDVVSYLSSGQSSYDISKAIRQEANQLSQQGYLNYSTALSVNNNLSQKEFENNVAAIGQRNNASQTELDNINKAITGDNDALQRAYENYRSSVGENNAMSITEYQTSINAASSRNATRQQDYQNQNNAIQYQNNMAQQGYQNVLNNINQNNAATQSRLANMQTFAGLNPIVSQGSQLSGLGQQSAPFMQTPVSQGIGLNPNAGQIGSNFALGVYGNQTSQYNSQMQYASQNSPLAWVTGVGSTIGGLF